MLATERLFCVPEASAPPLSNSGFRQNPITPQVKVMIHPLDDSSVHSVNILQNIE